MPVRFARLRIAGFKSFADPVSLEIMPGLTGVVGPNGCGKSNVVDALRWVMGEASAKSLRGGEMDDVIFAGTIGRASRNFGEVTVTLEETQGLAPPPFQAEAELEVTRRIERGSGSTYRVNGREARARDVATLFADFASGARASAMVSQGRVSALVSARPEERRVILEEAAGITGLHARRHEAELKLRAAEANLTRAEDLRGQTEARLGELRRQARQASRYRNLSGSIRAAEAEHLATERAIAIARREQARAAFAAANEAVQAAKRAAGEAEAAASAAETALAPLREAEAEARTALERAKIGAEQAVEEESRLRAARGEAESRAAIIARDHDHAARIVQDADQAAARLAEEESRLQAESAEAPALIELAESAAREAGLAAEAAEREATGAAETAARLAAETDAARRRNAEADTRARRARARHEEISTEHRRAAEALVDPARLAEAEAGLGAAEAEQNDAAAAIESARQAVAGAESARIAAEKQLAAARGAAIAAESQAARLRAEADALASLLAQKFGREQAPVLDEITVPPGLEAALGAALREELSAGQDAGAARFWRTLPPLGGEAMLSLSKLVTAPPALSRALDHILLLPDGASGEEMQASLAPGQILVSREGASWRWDGFTIHAGAPNEAAARLAQRNRLTALRADLARAAEAAEAARTKRAEAESAERAARAGEAAARDARAKAEARLDRARADLAKRRDASTKLEAEAARAAARAAALEGELARAGTERAEAESAFEEARAALAALPDADAARRAVDAARARLTESRRQENAARNRIAQQRAAQDQRAKRLEILRREAADWAERARDAQSRLTDLAARRDAAGAALKALADSPDPAHLKRAAFEAREAAGAFHKTASERLAAAIRAAESARGETRAREAALAAAREDVVRQEGAVSQADHDWGSITETILQRLGADPTLPEVAEATPEAAERARRRFERLTRERDEMGPVNLRAEIELAEIESRIAVIERERDDIAGAIAKLRGSIGHLNREGRERLSAVFAEVDRHFQALFTRMFGGGRAHLALVGSDDPLLAGLEIYTQPPGKKLATLSLLSGGEQALTALSLIFAVFRCNPAPISVLDEVDAPLDDANVERFCDLLDDVARETGTRMLVVTHHHLTMARMDRLYGVTMQERGVSRLLSVDLTGAVAMAETGDAAIAAE